MVRKSGERMKKLLISLLATFAITSAQAQFLAGNDLYKLSEVASAYYVVGVMDNTDLYTTPAVKYCVPANVSAGQARDVVFKYLRDFPEYRDRSASMLVVFSLSKAFPCVK